ncbi:hypothetical protein EHS25_006050 [Saitozyma podzolica]|jgi:hypothetical protein|uniref:Uncharacterized protein n=1 Tax=Saitozyma podzolica TaxID=1890683 RepID=A0A427XTI1_9TREE|nr:hypothetical protein EHS25_006050 [Saitozyma podzolica]
MSAATKDSSEAPLIVSIKQSHWDEAETEIRSFAELKQDPKVLEAFKTLTLTKVMDEATDAANRLPEYSLAFKRNLEFQKVLTQFLSTTSVSNDKSIVSDVEEMLQDYATKRDELFNAAFEECLSPIAALLTVTDDSDGTCLSGDLDGRCKKRVQVARKAAKDFLALAKAVREIATTDVNDAMSRVSTASQSQ